MNKLTANRYHDFCAGHRVVGHENKCANLHGHNYRVHFFVKSLDGTDSIGRVIDFAVIGKILCEWLERNWDHKMLIWSEDPIKEDLSKIASIIEVPFNPTAENMACYLVNTIAPQLFINYQVRLVKVLIEETRKCSVTYEL